MNNSILSSVKWRRRAAAAGKLLVGIGICLLVLAPIVITLFASLKTKADMTNTSPLLLPEFGRITLENYKDVLSNKKFYIGLKNSFLIASISIVFNVILGSITAYCLERFHFRFRKAVFGMFFLGMMVPTFVTEIARFGLISSMGLYNTLAAPIVIYVASDLMQLYIYRQFISKISVSLDESALIDGCGYFRLFWQIIFPLLAPATATVVVIKVVNIINDMYIPYLYMPSNKLQTLTTFLMQYSNAQKGSWQSLSAAIMIVMIPTILIYVFAQRYIMDGLAAGAVKE